MKITKTRLKEIIKEELERLQREALDPRDKIKGDPPYVIEHVGAEHKRYFVKFVNRGEGDYETVFGSYDQAWTTDDEDRAGYMAGIVTQRTGFQTTVEPVASI